MRERMEMVGGSLRVESAPGEGTSIHAEIPIMAAPKVPRYGGRG
jgi:signal transduction histidine kinase